VYSLFGIQKIEKTEIFDLNKSWEETKNELLEGLSGTKREIVSTALDHQKNTNGSTPTVNNFSKTIIPIIRRVMPSVIASQLVGVQPMTSSFFVSKLDKVIIVNHGKVDRHWSLAVRADKDKEKIIKWLEDNLLKQDYWIKDGTYVINVNLYKEEDVDLFLLRWKDADIDHDEKI